MMGRSRARFKKRGVLQDVGYAIELERRYRLNSSIGAPVLTVSGRNGPSPSPVGDGPMLQFG
jgi:hypothetical protein